LNYSIQPITFDNHQKERDQYQNATLGTHMPSTVMAHGSWLMANQKGRPENLCQGPSMKYGKNKLSERRLLGRGARADRPARGACPARREERPIFFSTAAYYG